ncbi:hypothetical protein ANDO1_1731 [plant metagenome]|uniref:Rad50/SbcC-type AAA domain-containing protein n=1 Tax=plant metagenome TaxID=1297885 RepID=A0A484P762_9ZZZZ
MKIQSIEIQNFQSLRAVHLPITTPLVLVGGDNEAGKSSLCEAIRMALLGENGRVDYKKDMGQLVTDGATDGVITVETAGGGVSVLLPDGKQHGTLPETEHPALPYVLEPRRFAAASADDRRTLMFRVTGTSASSAVVLGKLKERGCDETLASGILPMLRAGFPAAKEFADGKARDAKANWRAVTGEAWGSKKAEGWQAAKPDFDQAMLTTLSAELDQLSTKVGEQQQHLGGLREKSNAYATRKAQAERREAQAHKLPSLRTKLATDEAGLAEWEGKVTALQARAGTGPREGLVHDLARCLAQLWASEASKNVAFGIGLDVKGAIAEYERQHGKLDASGDPEAAAALPKAIESRDLMKRSVANDKRDIAAVEAAAADQDASAVECVEPADVQVAQAELQRLQIAQREVQQRRQALLDAQRVVQECDGKTQAAAAHHAEVAQWLKVSEAMAPDGIPSELLAAALGPVNKLLGELSTLAGWTPVSIDDDLTIRCGARFYRQQSASAQWRADTILALALAELSGLRVALLDAFDILNMAGRGQVLDLLDELAVAGRVDTVILLGTLKAPTAAPTDAYVSHWIEGGRLLVGEQLREAA